MEGRIHLPDQCDTDCRRKIESDHKGRTLGDLTTVHNLIENSCRLPESTS
jgi:hypothetical protein